MICFNSRRMGYLFKHSHSTSQKFGCAFCKKHSFFLKSCPWLPDKQPPGITEYDIVAMSPPSQHASYLPFLAQWLSF